MPTYGLFAETLFGDGKNLFRAFGRNGADRDDKIAFSQIDAAHAARDASHRAHVGFVKADRHAVVRGDENLLFAVGADDVQKLVAFVNVDGVDAVDADVLIIATSEIFLITPCFVTIVR